MTERLDRHVLNNGMIALGEPIKQVESVAFTFMLPAGAARLDEGCCGAGAVITDWLFRGAGDMDSRALIDALDGLGLHRGSSVTGSHISLGAALEASNLANALELYADMILRPTLDKDQFDLSRQLAIHDVVGLDDDPRQKVMLKLREQFYPSPFGRSTMGNFKELNALTSDRCAAIVKDRFNLSGTIFAISGKYDFDSVCKQLDKLFGRDESPDNLNITPGPTGTQYTHIQHDGAQVHIGLMTEVPPITTDDYYDASAAVSVLSGGMSSRLFTEVREKRGLCYAVGARYHTLKNFAGIACYAGTTPDKADETLEVITDQFNRLGEGITEDEIHRAKVGIKSALIMQSESSSARAAGIASDHYLLGRVRSIAEIKEKLEKLSVSSVTDFLSRNRFENYTVVTIGPKSVETSEKP